MQQDKELARLFERVKEQGISDKELARRTGIPRVTIYRVKNGKGEPLYSTRMRIFNALNRVLDE